jgi:hypothetical protein
MESTTWYAGSAGMARTNPGVGRGPTPPTYLAVRGASKAELADRALKREHAARLLEGQQDLSREDAFVLISE